MCRTSREVLSLLLRSFLLVPKELHYLTYLHLEAENLGRKINEQFDPSNDYYTFLSSSPWQESSYSELWKTFADYEDSLDDAALDAKYWEMRWRSRTLMHWLSFETKWVGIAPDKQFGTHEVKLLLGEKP